jgi:hypothetical protein
MKRCSMCGETKRFDDFMWNHIATGKRDSYCRPCRALYKREHYAANKQRYLDNAAAWTRRTAVDRLSWLLDYFEEHPCVDCGESDPVVLEFDHLRDKKFGVATGMRNKNWELVLAEIEKCDVVCANCHRRRTARRGGFRRAGVAQLVELQISNLEVAGPSPVSRSS